MIKNILIHNSNETILNVFRNYVLKKYFIVNDKNRVWMNDTTKSKIETKITLYKTYTQNGIFESDFVFLENLITDLTS